jgi:hypothetical protein
MHQIHSEDWMHKLLFAFLISFAVAAMAVEPVNRDPETLLAMHGYDPVAYFTTGGPVEGQTRFVFRWNGALWRFASAENLASFKASPERFAPQYGGYCAYGIAKGYAVNGDPLAWKVVGGKLYLNYDAKVQKAWEADIPGYIEKAEINWPKVLAE